MTNNEDVEKEPMWKERFALDFEARDRENAMLLANEARRDFQRFTAFINTGGLLIVFTLIGAGFRSNCEFGVVYLGTAVLFGLGLISSGLAAECLLKIRVALTERADNWRAELLGETPPEGLFEEGGVNLRRLRIKWHEYVTCSFATFILGAASGIVVLTFWPPSCL